jgi:poly(3-hydroxybutyrate) depolymerase
LPLLILLASSAFAAGDSAELRTGFFRVSMTPLELLGAGAEGVANILPSDEEVEWEIVVPNNYSASTPPGLVVYVSPRERGGPPRDWNDMLQEHNLIWIGANKSGNDWPVPQRMLKAMIAPMVLAKSYAINPDRVYVAGMSGGGKTATRVATARPEVFKGGVYMAGTVSWADNVPPKIDLIRENYHVFLIGTNDPAILESRRTYKDYKDAGAVNSKLITIYNFGHHMPSAEYFARAIDYLDSRYAE